MRITRFSDFGLRALIYLAPARETRPPVTVAEIASQFDIPANHLVKVVGHLARAGWVQATRGRAGGLRLNIDPASLKIGDVLRELEGATELINCDAQVCALRLNCGLRDALRVGMNAFYDAMNSYTLADVVAGGTGEKIVRMHHRLTAGQSLQ